MVRRWCDTALTTTTVSTVQVTGKGEKGEKDALAHPEDECKVGVVGDGTETVESTLMAGRGSCSILAMATN